MIAEGVNVYNKSREEVIFTPNNPKKISQKDVFRYLQNLELEIDQGLFTQNELLLLRDALYGKFLDRSRRPFFLYHFLPLWVDAVRILFHDNARRKIIELGCGTGTSSLLFAMLGAHSIGLEIDADLIEICNKRNEFYKKYIDSLNAEFYQTNTFDFPYEDHEPIDAFFSLFAFNLMKPCDALLSRIIPSLKQSGKLVIIDGNCNNIYSRLIPSRSRPGVLSPMVMQKKLETLGCKVLKVETHCAIPPFVFRFSRFQKLALKVEETVKSFGVHRFFGVSYMIVAEKVS